MPSEARILRRAAERLARKATRKQHYRTELARISHSRLEVRRGAKTSEVFHRVNRLSFPGVRFLG